ncbi:MAG TPA: plastocyanin/azurin family copper-binding protein [Burkholderiaceae bacterium]|nr:plastocyanin/azurin family copper-binding protein [Burkholderiaceae bacterium]HYB50958.1 plastocyanin/azurin family copper-binding protein [Burkholderiaceae bacterium]
MKVRMIALLGVLMGLVSVAAAKEIKVKMLTNGPNGTMLVFDPMFVKANVGDTVTFEPLQKAGHTSISLLVPEGAKPWKAAADTEISVKIEKPGVYLVECDLHKNMGMVAVLQAGKPVNLAEAKKKAAEESAKMLANKDRYDKLLAMVK